MAYRIDSYAFVNVASEHLEVRFRLVPIATQPGVSHVEIIGDCPYNQVRRIKDRFYDVGVPGLNRELWEPETLVNTLAVLGVLKVTTWTHPSDTVIIGTAKDAQVRLQVTDVKSPVPESNVSTKTQFALETITQRVRELESAREDLDILLRSKDLELAKLTQKINAARNTLDA